MNLTKDQKEFWDFDFEEMGVYDVPAVTDFILAKTGHSKLAAYIGHSEGTTEFFIGASLDPDYFEQKVNIFIALAPVVRLDHSPKELLVWAAQHNGVLPPLVQATGAYDLLPHNYIMEAFYANLCEAAPHVCEKLDEGFFDWNDTIDNADRYASKMAHSPQGCGWRNLEHYA